MTINEIDQLRQQYVADWEDWPADEGAPWYADSSGIVLHNESTDTFDYANPHDIPGIPGAAQTIWFVCNDLSNSSNTLLGSPPIGIEEQMALWDYDTIGALNDTYFEQVRLIYKGTPGSLPSSEIDSAYIVQWMDPDNGTY